MKLFINLLVSSLSVFITAYILPGVTLDSFTTALIVAVVLGLINAIIRPVLIILTLPITIITLGLFTFIITGVSVVLVDYIVEGFSVDSFLWAMVFGLVLSLVSSFLRKLS